MWPWSNAQARAGSGTPTADNTKMIELDNLFGNIKQMKPLHMIDMLKNDDNYIFNVLLKVAIDYLKVIKVV